MGNNHYRWIVVNTIRQTEKYFETREQAREYRRERAAPKNFQIVDGVTGKTIR